MNKLVINTANNDLMIVLEKEDKVFCEIEKSKLHHNETMLPLIDKILKDNNLEIKQIDEFGVVVGPGSFTGIRVGISTIKAFRDAIGSVTKGINNLDYLFALSKQKNPECELVAIYGSKNSYFVARWINGQLYKYERNLTKQEIENITNKPVGMFEKDSSLNCFVVENDADILLDCFERSFDENLIPIYYQLSQAETEKIKKETFQIVDAEVQDIQQLELLESLVKTNPLSKQELLSFVGNKNYKVLKLICENEIIALMVLQITDEVNIENIVVKKEFQNQGYATKLLNYAEQIALQNGIKTMSLEVSVNNITAFLLYEKMGYTTRRIRKNLYSDGSDCKEMVKFL